MSLPPPAERGDRLPVWVVVLLALFLLLRVVGLFQDAAAKSGGRLSQSLAGSVDDKTMEETLSTNLTTKSAFALSAAQPGKGAFDTKSLRDALKSAEALQKDTHNAPTSARRVILLRGLLHLPILAVGRNGLDPRLAFAPASLAGLPAQDQARYAAEGRLWADVARGPHLTPAQTDAYARQLRATPNIRWWLSPALSVLYESQGNPAEAVRYRDRAQSRAWATLAPYFGMTLLWGALGLGGLVLLLYLLIRALHNRQIAQDPPSPDAAPPLPDPWPTLPETVPLAQRRLRAGDLMGVFVLYLLMPDIFGRLLVGFDLPGHHHVPGLLTGYLRHSAAMPISKRVAASVVLEFFAYLLGAAIPIGVLLALARKHGADLGAELGWNGRRLRMNLLYGVGGYAVGLPLMLLASLTGRHIHTPSPSNPAIPLLANASTWWVQALLVLLATVAAPLTEELLFRGVFYNAAKLRVGAWPAIVLTGLIFGFVHPVGLGEMLPLAVLGGVFAWMAETRKSLAPSILGHCLQNTMATLMLLLALGS